MEPALLPIREATLQILQRAGHRRLAMALQHRQINQKVCVQRPARNLHRAQGSLNGAGLIFFEIVKRNAIFRAHLIIAAGLHGALGVVPNPGTFDHTDPGKALFLKVFDATGEHTGMCGRTGIRGAGKHKIRLERNGCAGWNHF